MWHFNNKRKELREEGGRMNGKFSSREGNEKCFHSRAKEREKSNGTDVQSHYVSPGIIEREEIDLSNQSMRITHYLHSQLHTQLSPALNCTKPIDDDGSATTWETSWSLTGALTFQYSINSSSHLFCYWAEWELIYALQLMLKKSHSSAKWEFILGD